MYGVGENPLNGNGVAAADMAWLRNSLNSVGNAERIPCLIGIFVGIMTPHNGMSTLKNPVG